MLLAIIFLGLFFFIGTYSGENPKNKRGLLYSILISITILIVFTFFGTDPQFNGLIAAMSGLGFYAGFKKGKKTIEQDNKESKVE